MVHSYFYTYLHNTSYRYKILLWSYAVIVYNTRTVSRWTDDLLKSDNGCNTESQNKKIHYHRERERSQLLVRLTAFWNRLLSLQVLISRNDRYVQVNTWYSAYWCIRRTKLDEITCFQYYFLLFSGRLTNTPSACIQKLSWQRFGFQFRSTWSHNHLSIYFIILYEINALCYDYYYH